jgi:hypothetical protein
MRNLLFLLLPLLTSCSTWHYQTPDGAVIDVTTLGQEISGFSATKLDDGSLEIRLDRTSPEAQLVQSVLKAVKPSP